jgi:hypothetical protein
MRSDECAEQAPFLFRFLEDESATGKTSNASPERGGESNPKEEAPRPEPTKPGPWGD